MMIASASGAYIPLPQITIRFDFFRYIAFAMHLDIVSTCIAKFMYLQKGKRIVIWDGGSIFQATIHAHVITFILL
jgi:hypothetical protein